MVFSLKNHHFKKSIPPEGTFAPITRNSVIVMENKRSHNITRINTKIVESIFSSTPKMHAFLDRSQFFLLPYYFKQPGIFAAINRIKNYFFYGTFCHPSQLRSFV